LFGYGIVMHSYFIASLSSHDLATREWGTITLSEFEAEWNYYVQEKLWGNCFADSEARFCQRKGYGQLVRMLCLLSSTRLWEASQELFIYLVSFHNYITPQYWFLHAIAPSDHLHPQQRSFPRSKSQHLVRDHS
jgi:hypothetical protein